MPAGILFLPDIFKAEVFLVIDDFDPPSHWIRRDGKGRVFLPIHGQRTKLVRRSRFDLRFASLTQNGRDGIDPCGGFTLFTEYPAPRGFTSHLRLSGARNNNLQNQTHESISLLKVLEGPSAHPLRVFLGIHEGLCEDILDLVNPRF